MVSGPIWILRISVVFCCCQFFFPMESMQHSQCNFTYRNLTSYLYRAEECVMCVSVNYFGLECKHVWVWEWCYSCFIGVLEIYCGSSELLYDPWRKNYSVNNLHSRKNSHSKRHWNVTHHHFSKSNGWKLVNRCSGGLR